MVAKWSKWYLIHTELFHINVTANLHYNMDTFTIFAMIINTLDSIVH
jgi:hypothetical protein